MEDAPAFQNATDWTSELVIVGLRLRLYMQQWQTDSKLLVLNFKLYLLTQKLYMQH